MDGFWRVLRFIARSTWRLGILLAGLVVILAGAIMLVTPGPGVVVIVTGLAILATEFTWAEILLERAKRQAVKAKNKAVQKVAARRRPAQPSEIDAEVGA